MEEARHPIELRLSPADPDVGYLRLPAHPGPGAAGAVKKTVNLKDLIRYSGPEIHLDFSESGQLLGIEVVG